MVILSQNRSLPPVQTIHMLRPLTSSGVRATPLSMSRKKSSSAWGKLSAGAADLLRLVQNRTGGLALRPPARNSADQVKTIGAAERTQSRHGSSLPVAAPNMPAQMILASATRRIYPTPLRRSQRRPLSGGHLESARPARHPVCRVSLQGRVNGRRFERNAIPIERRRA